MKASGRPSGKNETLDVNYGVRTFCDPDESLVFLQSSVKHEVVLKDLV